MRVGAILGAVANFVARVGVAWWRTSLVVYRGPWCTGPRPATPDETYLYLLVQVDDVVDAVCRLPVGIGERSEPYLVVRVVAPGFKRWTVILPNDDELVGDERAAMIARHQREAVR